MPEMDGMDLLHAIRDPDETSRSSSSRARIRTPCRASDPRRSYHVTKPFDVDEVRDVIERAVEAGRLRVAARGGARHRPPHHGRLGSDSPGPPAAARVAAKDIHPGQDEYEVTSPSASTTVTQKAPTAPAAAPSTSARTRAGTDGNQPDRGPASVATSSRGGAASPR